MLYIPEIVYIQIKQISRKLHKRISFCQKSVCQKDTPNILFSPEYQFFFVFPLQCWNKGLQIPVPKGTEDHIKE